LAQALSDYLAFPQIVAHSDVPLPIILRLHS